MHVHLIFSDNLGKLQTLTVSFYEVKDQTLLCFCVHNCYKKRVVMPGFSLNFFLVFDAHTTVCDKSPRQQVQAWLQWLRSVLTTDSSDRSSGSRSQKQICMRTAFPMLCSRCQARSHNLSLRGSLPPSCSAEASPCQSTLLGSIPAGVCAGRHLSTCVTRSKYKTQICTMWELAIRANTSQTAWRNRVANKEKKEREAIQTK